MASTEDTENLKVNINGGLLQICWLRKKFGITADMIKDGAITKEKLSEEVLTLLETADIQALYKEGLDIADLSDGSSIFVPEATKSRAGVMSSADKANLDILVAGGGGSGGGMTPQEKANLQKLMDKVFDWTVAYASDNAGTYEYYSEPFPAVTLTVEDGDGNSLIGNNEMTINVPSGCHLNESKNGWVADAPVKSIKSISTSVTYSGTTKTPSGDPKTWQFDYYKRYGVMDSMPSDKDEIRQAIVGATGLQWGTDHSLSSYTIKAGKYFIFAVRCLASVTESDLQCYLVSPKAKIGGCTTGVCPRVPLVKTPSITESYMYIIVPPSSIDMTVQITTD